MTEFPILFAGQRLDIRQSEVLEGLLTGSGSKIPRYPSSEATPRVIESVGYKFLVGQIISRN